MNKLLPILSISIIIFCFCNNPKNLKDDSELDSIISPIRLIEVKEGRCDQWKNKTFVSGDGINSPKIIITKTPYKIEGLYEGPDKGWCIQRAKYSSNDSPHQLAGITVFYEAAPYLKYLYKKGTYVTIGKITMKRLIDKMFKITIPLNSTTENKAITNINERGGMGHTAKNIYKIFADGIKNKSSMQLIGEQTVNSEDITEHFIYWRDISDFPIQKKTK